MNPSVFVTMHRVSRALRRHEWRLAVEILVVDEDIPPSAALAFVAWERSTTRDDGASAVRMR